MGGLLPIALCGRNLVVFSTPSLSSRNAISENFHDASQPVWWRRRSNSHGRRHDARTDWSRPIAQNNCEWLHRDNEGHYADAGQDQLMLLHDVFSFFDMDSKQATLWALAGNFTEHTTAASGSDFPRAPQGTSKLPILVPVPTHNLIQSV